jgi:hypothetical protein
MYAISDPGFPKTTTPQRFPVSTSTTHDPQSPSTRQVSKLIGLEDVQLTEITVDTSDHP